MKSTIFSAAIMAVLLLVAGCSSNPPGVTITNPANGAQIGLYDTVMVTAEMDDSDGDLFRTQLYFDTVAIAHSFEDTLSYMWVIHTHDTLSAKTIKVVAVDDAGNEQSAEINVTLVGEAPVIDFTVDSDTINAGSTAKFTDLTSNTFRYPNLTWTWDFGNDSVHVVTNNMEPEQVTYVNSGVYSVTLTVENEFGSNSLTKTGYIVVQ